MAGQAAELPLRTKVLFASSSLGSEAVSQSRTLWLLYYYAPPADADLPELLPAGLVAALLTIVRLADSFDDALVGYWSDRTRSRLGRRIPFILAATPFWALFAFLLFVPPADAGTATTAVYLFVVLQFYFVFATLSGGPYEALLPEIALTSRDRVTIVGVRVYMGAVGAGIGLAVSGVIVDAFGFKAMALVMATLALAFRYLGMSSVWNRARRTAPPADIPLREALRETFRNRPFIVFLPSFVLFQLGLQLVLGILPFYVTAVLGAENEGTWVGILTAVAIVAMLTGVPVFARFAAATSKRHAYATAMAAAAALFPLFFFAGFLPGLPKEAQIILVMAFAGFPVAGVYLFPAALTADIVDYDSTRTGMRREAIYYGAQNFVEKTVGAAVPLLIVLLRLVGDTAGDPLGIRLTGIVAGAAVLIGYLIFRGYRLPDQVLPSAARAV